ncbi:MAG: helix-turn-helix domain-containing protein [bacterium]|nr:helix-turn-helix domain-containing protein [bacterium]
MSLDRELMDLGLSSKEAKVYLALLELGTASAQAIARRAGIVRPTTYVILETLTRKGLASKATGPDAKKMLFVAEAPERLESYIQQQQQQLELRRQELSRLLPDLRSLHLQGEERPRVRFFEGKEGLKALQREFVDASKDEMVGINSEDAVEDLYPVHSEEFDREIRGTRVRAGIRSRHLYTSSKGLLRSKEDDARALRESRFMSPDRLPIKSSFAVHGPILSVVSFRGKIIGVLIEHQDIADSFRAIFEVLWNEAQAYQKPSGSPQTPS